MIRIGFIGTPGAGKTTTSRAVAGYIRTHTKYKTVELVDEYARKFIHKYGIDHIQDQVRIMNKQLELENKFPASTEVLITDSPIFLGFTYALDMRREGEEKDTMIINDIFKDMNRLNQVPRYDIIFHLPPTLPPTRDGIRKEEQFDPAWRQQMDIKLLSVFNVFPPRKLITIESTTLDDRVKECMKHINAFSNGNDISIEYFDPNTLSHKKIVPIPTEPKKYIVKEKLNGEFVSINKLAKEAQKLWEEENPTFWSKLKKRWFK